MAIKLNAAYSKKLGLPNYSSHSFAASVEVELTDPGSIAAETARLYATLQSSVDNEIRQTGYLPGANGVSPSPGNSSNGNGIPPRATQPHTNGNGSGNALSDAWQCSENQRQLITRLIAENGLDLSEIDALAEERFGCGLSALTRMQASRLIDEMLETYGRKNGNGSHRRPTAGVHRNGSAV